MTIFNGERLETDLFQLDPVDIYGVGRSVADNSKLKKYI